ncbi:hypothetical protein [Nocardioides mesophilus]|uniref:Amino acid transporter n=1 Tax=Nocardioides mesophilus TaxID=433659 RepID=A0A7G9R8U9_9ACTN|nr:hypothetical protein [Nocardioides mesophilus]QNN52024.1 hypothetical protein H9L09_16115 [Nocardioides mesophilus]
MSENVWEPTEEDRAFLDVYGPWDPLAPAELQRLMAGFEPPWWVVGGHAIEAFTGVRRVHEDIDLVVFADDVQALRAQLGGTFHLWGMNDGTMRVIDERHPDPVHPLCQIWMRVDASSPWRVDCILNPSAEGRWQSRHDDSFVADLDEVTWVAADGIRYLDPAITLLFKARQQRPKDAIDLANTWPLLPPERRAWLRDAVAHRYPDHPWTERLRSEPGVGTGG